MLPFLLRIGNLIQPLISLRTWQKPFTLPENIISDQGKTSTRICPLSVKFHFFRQKYTILSVIFNDDGSPWVGVNFHKYVTELILPSFRVLLKEQQIYNMYTLEC